MIGTRNLARTLLAGIFIGGGASALRKSRQLAPVAAPVADPMAKAVGVDTTSERLVQVNAAAQILGGAALVLNIVPRAAAIALGASLVPTTLAAHRFWEQDSDADTEAETLSFLKNAAILGGLVFAALDTGGRPSVFWSGKRAAANAAGAVSDSAHRTYDAIAN